mmetsp:Transcript_133342/g.385935  ORF Transcript_133342/g.385935 Transcript_133342/m.385935 type:complete len:171 (+) Transcript_133342:96-608(+)
MAEPVRSFGHPVIAACLDGLLEAQVPVHAPAEPWSRKSGFSIFDDEAVLGELRPVPVGPGGAAALGHQGHLGSRAAGPTQRISGNVADSSSEVSASRVVRLMMRTCCLKSLDHDIGSECPICLEPLRRGEASWRLPCFHQVHHSCSSTFFGTRGVSPRCPICRFDLRDAR